VRNRLLQQCPDSDHLPISTAFTSLTFKQLIKLANNPETNKILNSARIISTLTQEKPPPIKLCIEKYGQFFVEEYKHFINVHNMAFPSQFCDRVSENKQPNIQELNHQEEVVFNQKPL
jgi:hypothetical protein